MNSSEANKNIFFERQELEFKMSKPSHAQIFDVF